MGADFFVPEFLNDILNGGQIRIIFVPHPESAQALSKHLGSCLDSSDDVFSNPLFSRTL